jgi:hypothetical protein
MPTSECLNVAARVSTLLLSGAVLFASGGCGNPELGSVKVPKDLKSKGPMGYGPIASKGKSPSLGPGEFRPAPRAKGARR